MQMEGYAIVERDGVATYIFDNGKLEHSRVGIHIFTLELDDLSGGVRRTRERESSSRSK